MDINLLLSRFVLNLITPKEMINLGIDCLTRDIESESLNVLAGLSESETDKVKKYFAESIKEIGGEFPDKSVAGLVVAKDYAQKIVTGQWLPYEGARNIWIDLYDLLDRPKWLEYFMGAISEIDDIPGRYGKDSPMCKEIIKKYEDGIVSHAQEVLKK